MQVRQQRRLTRHPGRVQQRLADPGRVASETYIDITRYSVHDYGSAVPDGAYASLSLYAADRTRPVGHI